MRRGAGAAPGPGPHRREALDEQHNLAGDPAGADTIERLRLRVLERLVQSQADLHG